VGYDAAGNITTDQFGRAYTYSAESMVLSTTAGGTYTYGPDLERVRKDAGGAWTEYVRFGGEIIAEKNANGTWTDYVFAGGKRIAQFTAGATTPQYFWEDQLGSSRVMTDSAGASHNARITSEPDSTPAAWDVG
jgi:hypothetical protein